MSGVSRDLRGNNGMRFILGPDSPSDASFPYPTDGIAANVDYAGDIKSIVLSSEDEDDADVTFGEVLDGTASVSTITVTAIQSIKADSFWRLCWDNPGTVFKFCYSPSLALVTATGDESYLTGRVKLGLRPNLGGEARRSKERYDFETTLEVTFTDYGFLP